MIRHQTTRSVKSTRYVNDGEVDPSIAAMAKRVRWASVPDIRSGKITEVYDPNANYNFGPSGEMSEEDAWLFASRVGGFDSRIVDVFPKWPAPDEDLWLPTAYVRLLRNMNTETGVIVERSPLGDPESNKDVVPNWENNREQLTNIGLPPLAVDALLFLHGEVEKWGHTFQQEEDATTQDMIDLAKSIASSVPPLGKKWLADSLKKQGWSEDDASTQAETVYASGSNLLAFEALNDRRTAIAAMLRLRDPGVTPEQVERVVMSPMSIEEVRTQFAPASGRPGSGPRSGAAGSGEGSGMGMLLVGGLVLGGLLLFKGRKR